jgi:CBS domain containing-hemolysin-like protein
VIAWVVLGIGMVLSALGTMAVVSAGVVSRIELYRWITQKAPGSRAARALLAAPERTIGSALGLAAMGALLAGTALPALVRNVPLPLLLAVVLLVAAPAFLVCVYAFPRAAGRRWAESLIRDIVPTIERFSPIFAPVVPRASTVRPRADLAREPTAPESNTVSATDELEVLSGVLAFSERPVREVMTPRTDIIAMREAAPLDDVARVFAESGYARLPVYRESLDNIIGMFYAFDLLKLLPGTELEVRHVTMVPGSIPCADLLFQMQRDRHQMAVVLDEYGGTAGIASLQDLLNELVEEAFEPLHLLADDDQAPADVIDVPGTESAEDVAERFGIALPASDETIGGLLTRAAGRIPVAGERYELAGLEFDVLAATATRVERVVVRRGRISTVQLSAEGSR